MLSQRDSGDVRGCWFGMERGPAMSSEFTSAATHLNRYVQFTFGDKGLELGRDSEAESTWR